jgi:hypothetical protein
MRIKSLLVRERGSSAVSTFEDGVPLPAAFQFKPSPSDLSK